MKLMSAAAVERAMAKRITWFQTAEILGISCRQIQRWKTGFEHEGYEGLFESTPRHSLTEARATRDS
jgi:hypothetical protein